MILDATKAESAFCRDEKDPRTHLEIAICAAGKRSKDVWGIET